MRRFTKVKNNGELLYLKMTYKEKTAQVPIANNNRHYQMFKEQEAAGVEFEIEDITPTSEQLEKQSQEKMISEKEKEIIRKQAVEELQSEGKLPPDVQSLSTIEQVQYAKFK